jgi:hypothetical protein
VLSIEDSTKLELDFKAIRERIAAEGGRGLKPGVATRPADPTQS